MQKLLVVFICLIGIACIDLVRTETVQTWGELYNVRAIDEKRATASWILLTVRTRKLRLPSVIYGQLQ